MGAGMIGPQSQPAHAAQVIAQKAKDLVVLLDLDTGEYYNLDEVGTRIWELCDGARTVSEIARCIGEEFDASGEPVEHDVMNFLGELVQDKLVRCA
jgi:Coenzyme PQQ synthesis protein D (PqqD)